MRVQVPSSAFLEIIIFYKLIDKLRYDIGLTKLGTPRNDYILKKIISLLPKNQIYHTNNGRVIFESKLLELLVNGNMHNDPARFEFYFTGLKSKTFSRELIQKLGIEFFLHILKENPANEKEINNFCQKCHFMLISIMQNHDKADYVNLLTMSFFQHYFYALTPASKINKSHIDWCLELVKQRFGSADELKEKVFQNESEVELCLLLSGDEVVRLTGTSIKTLRKKAYKILLDQFLQKQT